MANKEKFIPAIAIHPGKTLEEKLKEMGMSVKEFAVRTSKPEKTIFAVIKGKSSITSDMAIAFESVTKIPAHFWLNKQRHYDEYVAREKRKKDLSEEVEWAKSFPIWQMQKMGWVPKVKTDEDKVKIMHSYFQVSSRTGWGDYYLNKQLKVAFRISLSSTKDPYAVSAWLRKGEIQASALNVGKYSEAELKQSLPRMKELSMEQPDDFSDKLQQICMQCGIKLIFTPCIPHAPINGSTRWIGDSPCIQMSDRFKRNDIFWFSFFHEVGHILLHGKKDIFLESIEYDDKQLEKEEEANEFASKLLLSPTEEDEIIKNGNFSKESICFYADKFKTHPAVILGRLQHKKIIAYNKYQDLIVKIDFTNSTNLQWNKDTI